MKLIILDRDGVINYESIHYIKSPAEWHAIPGSLAAMTKLHQAGYKIAIASNQSGVSRGYYTEETLTAIHDKMQKELAQHGGIIDKIAYCIHLPSDNCDCRKPKTGLLIQIANHFGCSLQDVPFIGDRASDVEAALAVGAQPILVGMTPTQIAELEQQFQIKLMHFENLSAAVTALLQEQE